MKDFASFGEGDVRKEAEKYLGSVEGKSENDVLREIYERAERGKREGTLSNADIDAFCARFAGMLDPVQRKKLYRLAEKLKRL